MANQVVRQRSINIAREDDATKGTGVATTTGHWIAVERGSLERQTEAAENESAVGRIEAGIERNTTKEWSMLSFRAPVKTDWLGHILTGLLGTVSSANSGGETLTRDHTITVNNSVDAPAYTVFMKGLTVSEKATYGTIKSLKLECEAGGELTAEVEILAQAMETGTGTTAFATDHHFQGSMFALKFGAALTNLTAASAVNFHSMEITIERDVQPHFVFGSTEPNTFISGGLRVTGKLKLLHVDATYLDRFTDDTEKAMRLDFLDTGTTIGSAENPRLKIDLAKVYLTNVKRSDDSDDVDMEEMEFKAYYDLDEGSPEMLDVLMVNEESATAYDEPA